MKALDLIGKRFNNLVVIERVANSPNGQTVWKCKCDCGNTTIVRRGNLISGAVKSCGCLVRKKNSENCTHKMSKTRLYQEWAGIKARCVYKNSVNNSDYGGRGIKMCKEWADSFVAFRDWALQNGYRDDLTIERIDVNGEYCPENCKWIPKSEQSSNRRSCIIITYNGKTQNLNDWCKELKLDYKRTNNRIKKLGWSFEKAISEPVDIKKRNMKIRKLKEGV